MKKIYLLSGMFRQRSALYLTVVMLLSCMLLQQKAIAQNPNLPTKATLAQTLLTNKTFTNASAVDTAVKPFTGTGAYTLEVVAKVNSATGRGMDIEARNAALAGFRVSLDAANLKLTNPLTGAATLTASKAAEEHVLRIAVKNDSAHIYQNGAYIISQPLANIKDIVNGTESDQLSNVTYDTSLMARWAGVPGNNSGAPNAYGWAYTGTTVTNLFNTANSSSGVRYIDVTPTVNQHTYNSSAYTGRVMYIRWDNSTYQNMVYSYPVTLEANTTYDFSWLYSLTANNSGSQPLVVGIGKTVYTADRIATKTFYTTTVLKDLKKDNFTFTSQDAGTYYITINGNFALYSIAELSLRKFSATPRFVFGKNYSAGAVNMEIVSATYEEGAYAPAALVTRPRQTATLTGTTMQIPATFNTDFVVPGKTDVHFTAENTPYSNSSIALNSNNSWLFFDNVRPDRVISDWLPTVTINGAAAVNNTNVRIAVYKNGTAVIPNGNGNNSIALEVFIQPGGAGTSQTYPILTIQNNLGAFNNSIRSFKLKRGYMATLANNADGSGYSRVFIANDSDLVVNAMPAGLDTTVSFIRVMQWNWPSKKGKAGWDPNKIGATWYYDWNIAGGAAPNYEYQGIRQNAGWPAYGDIINKGVNHISGFNEPDQTNQSNLTVDQAFDNWKGMYSTGVRVGSPSPASPETSWITNFLAKCDSFNYRVDYVTIHCYWGGQTPQQWYNRLLAIYNRVKRPLWITEWNNGANWTTETWPTDATAQLQKQLNDMKGILQVLDTASFIERYAEYDWVENKRALVLADTLTPAGKYYYTNKSDFAYNPAKAFVHTWKLVSPRLYNTINNADYFKTMLSWNDLNGETGSKYILERKIDGRDTGFLPVQDFTGYAVNGAMSFGDSVYSKATYRLKAVGIDGTTFVYSGSLDVTRDATPVAPTSLTGTVISSSRIQLNWNAGTNVRSYNLKRTTDTTGTWTVLATRTTALSYLDTALAANTTYYYVVTTLNSAGESVASPILQKTTPPFVAPIAVLNPRVASAESRTTLTWDFQYDAKYVIMRSEDPNATFDTVANNIDALRFVDSNRTNGTTYYYKVAAFNPAGRSPLSAMLTAKPWWGQQLYISFNDTAALAEDVWGGYNATLGSTASRDTAGYAARALKLDGTTNAYATLADAPVAGLNNFTLSTWIKMTAFTNWMRIFDFGTGTNQYMFLTPQVSVSNGMSTLRYAIKNGGAEQTVSYAYTFPLNTWTHLAVSQSGNLVKLYINGMLVATNNAVTIRPSDLGNTTLNYLGKSQFSADPLLKGSIDEMRIYNYALSDVDVISLSQGNPVVLPITLASFIGKATQQGNLLNWKVNTTSASIGMQLEKSGDGRNFSPIYSLTATHIATQSPFSFTDVHANGAINYYRLKMTDVDGKISYSPVVAITSTVKGMQLVGLYPSLVNTTTYLSIATDKEARLKVVITDVFGRTMQWLNKTVVTGSNLLNIDASALASGTYTISVYDNNLRMGSIRFVINH